MFSQNEHSRAFAYLEQYLICSNLLEKPILVKTLLPTSCANAPLDSATQDEKGEQCVFVLNVNEKKSLFPP